MGPAAIGVMAGSTALGLLGGRQQANAANQPTRTQSSTTPWNAGAASDFYNQFQGDYNQARNNVNWAPSGEQNALWAQLLQGGRGGRGRGGGGGQQQQSGGGRVGPRGPGIMGRLARNNVALSDYEQRVLGDEFLNLEDNPYIQQRLDAMARENAESQSRAMGAAFDPFVQAGGTMGMSGAAMGARGRLADDFSENLLNQNAGFLGDQYQFERGQQTAANQAWSGRESTYDASAFQNNATIRAAQAAAAAQRYAADQQLRASRGAQGLAGRQFQHQRLMDLYGLAGGRAGDVRNQQGLGNLGLSAQYGAGALPWQTSFGTTNQTSQGPQYNTGLAGLAGGLGGALSGYGAAQGFGLNLGRFGGS